MPIDDPYARRPRQPPAGADNGQEGQNVERPTRDDLPSITLPKGGGAIRGIGETFSVNSATGTAGIGVPIPTSPGRSGFGPQVSLSYDSGAGNGPFGLGWSLQLPSITRRTDRGLPLYVDQTELDIFILAGSDDLVPVYRRDGAGNIILDAQDHPIIDDVERDGHSVRPYRPRIDASLARIERWTRSSDGSVHWRTISKENVTTMYGLTPESRIADPVSPQRVFSWLICQSFDDKGNAIVYEYVAENSQHVLEDALGHPYSPPHERNRTDQSRSANRYLKRIKYGNRTPNRDANRNATDPSLITDWMFEVLFDYDDGHFEVLPDDVDGNHFRAAHLTPTPGVHWSVRRDPFSTYRAAFEIRTYRLCRRVLMFHHFADQLGLADCLIASTEFTYSESPAISFLTDVLQAGYIRQPDAAREDRYLRKEAPAMQFEYSPVPSPEQMAAEPIRTIDSASVEHLPYGVDGARYRWTDLDGEGSPGVITESAGGWFYKRNLSATNIASEDGANRPIARFGPVETLPRIPNASLASGGAQLIDLAGDGQIDLVMTALPTTGFYERTRDFDWERFRTFGSWPTFDPQDPNFRLVDLDGDGRADVLITEQDAITWYPSLGEQGFDRARRVVTPDDEERGPKVVFADTVHAIVLADMSGDGLSDLVRIRNGEVCYWPNLGYGRFGAKVTLDHAPLFDGLDQFDPRRVHLADTDGSGTMDIIYLGGDAARLYPNQSGNGLGTAVVLPQFPIPDSAENVQLIDLLGNGTMCLVSSSRLPAAKPFPMRYLDIMGGQKPHLLRRFSNQTGSETTVEYRPSTFYYLQDRAAGTPWATRLPFPVQCVDRVIVEDHVREVRFVTSYTYHHGHFDGTEREFRGFARVEQLDTETFVAFKASGAGNAVEEDLHQVPALVKTWFHTGAWTDEPQRALHHFRDEYFQNPVRPEHMLQEPALPDGLSLDEAREAQRALKGLMLRQEVYAVDGSAAAGIPYATSESTSRVQLLQPRKTNRYASFLVTSNELIAYTYERNPADPRISHSLILETDDIGLARKTAQVAYPRFVVDPDLPATVTAAQTRLFVTYQETNFTNDVRTSDAYRSRVECESRSFELTGLVLPATFASRDLLLDAIANAAHIPYEAPASGGLQLRLLDRKKAAFLRDDLSGPLPFGTLESLGLAHQSYQLAFTSGLVAQYYGAEVSDAQFTAAGYTHRDGDSDWWVPSGMALYDAATAAAHFFLASRFQDSLGTLTTVRRDSVDLLVEQTTDALGNVVTSDNDYRTLGPVSMVDINGNRSSVEIDALGVVVKAAVMGKDGAGDGDTLADPTSRVEYDLFNWRDRGQPNFVHTFVREKHGASNPRFQEAFAYQDGSGSAIMMKVQAEPGLALRLDPITHQVEVVDTTPQVRWVGTGRTVFNNKGNAVKQYEPYFSVTSAFETAEELVGIGITPLVHYDPLGRSTKIDLPNGSVTRTEWGTWHDRRFDPNDTVLESTWYSDRGSPDPNGPVPADPQGRAAWLAAQHADTPTVAHIDGLGRGIYAIADNGSLGTRTMRTDTDLTGRFVKAFDAMERLVSDAVTNIVGDTIAGNSAERGDRRIFADVLGNVVRTWDGAGRFLRTEYDILHRLTDSFFRQGAGTEIVHNHIVYGELHPNAAAFNLRGRPHQMYDQAGAVTFNEFDFKGNLTAFERRLALDYKLAIDWSSLHGLTDLTAIAAAANGLLEAEVFTSSSTYDALGRPQRIDMPDGTVIKPTFDEGNHLGSLAAQIFGQGPDVSFVNKLVHDVRGRRQTAEVGSGVVTRYFYESDSLRLRRVIAGLAGQPDSQSLQDLNYTYDPAGNVVQVTDAAQQTHYFNNSVVPPQFLYEFDPLYELVRASGREHAGAGGDVQRGPGEIPVQALPHANDAGAVRNYTEIYNYDAAGNILAMQHVAAGGSWTRAYRYKYQNDPNDRTNQLASTSEPGDPPGGPFSANYTYDSQANITAMPHLASLNWDFLDRLRSVDLGGGGTAFYVYGATGQRLRKVIEHIGGTREERIYLGASEVHRKFSAADAVTFERRTVHISDDVDRIAQVDIKTSDPGGSDTAPLNVPVTRYVHTNNLGSAVLETDDAGNPISYEEYHPFGTTAYWSSRAGFDVSLKRYRFVGKERDAETGLYYFGARYCATWLGRWISADPAGFGDGLNQHAFARNNPVTMTDPSGTQAAPKVVQQRMFTGQETFEQVRDYANSVPGHQFDSRITPTNFSRKSHYVEGPGENGTGGVWQVLVPASPTPEPQEAPVVTGGPASSGGHEAVKRNPEGFTLELDSRTSPGKMQAYKERIQTDRGVAHRARNPATGKRTEDLRRATRGLRDDFEAGLPGGRRPLGTDVGHKVDVQHVGRYNDTVRPQDFQVEPSGSNRSEGTRNRALGDRQIASGVREEVPAGGAARTQDMGKFYNKPGVRTAARGVGYGLAAAGPILTYLGASSIENEAVRYTGYGLAAAEAAGVGIYAYGRVVQGGGAAGSQAGLATMKIGSRLLGVAGGAAQALLSGYSAIEDYKRGDWTALGFDAASALGGVALMAAPLVAVAAPAIAVGLVVAGIVTGVAAGIYHLGKWRDWW